MSTAVEIVYRGHDNVVDATFRRYDSAQRKYVPLNFANVTRMVLAFANTSPVIAFDSDITQNVMDWSSGNGRVVFDISKYALPVGVYVAQLVAYDPANTNGVVITDGLDDPLLFEVREVLSSGVLPPPMPENGSAIVRQAGETISALKFLYEFDGQVFALGNVDEVNIYRWVGIALNAADPGEQVTIQRSGSLEDSNWNWVDGERVYLGLNGTLTQTVPVVGYQQLIGTAVSTKRILLNIQDPIEL